jgi:hypothetical protein
MLPDMVDHIETRRLWSRSESGLECVGAVIHVSITEKTEWLLERYVSLQLYGDAKQSTTGGFVLPLAIVLDDALAGM